MTVLSAVRPTPRTGASAIEIRGARTHSLKDVSCSIPIGALTVITGPSGSGKSSLAFDTLYAEGQRRFVESMSTYARQFLERLDRPDVDAIEHILPAIAVAQRTPFRSARSTVGTATEIDDVMRLLFASAGTTICPVCRTPVTRDTTTSVLATLLSELGEGTKLLVTAPRRGEDPREIEEWIRAGYFRAVGADGSVLELAPGAVPPRDAAGHVRLLVGRHVLSSADPEVARSIADAFDLGEGRLEVLVKGTPDVTRRFHRGLVCNTCSRAFQEPTPALFSFNSPRGACEACQGFGRIASVDSRKVIPDPTKSLEERPIAPFNSPAYASAYDDLRKASRRLRLRWDVPWNELSEEERGVVWSGRGSWYGVKGLMEWLEKKRYKVHVRVFLSRWRGYSPCPSCGGARLREDAHFVRVGGRTISDLARLSLEDLLGFLKAGPLGAAERARSGHLVADLVKRVETLVSIGLPYLSLSRTMRTLSGGEAQRIQLGSAIGNALTGTLYVLDEPTMGLHPRDTRLLLGVLRRLAEGGNAVAVVEHDTDVVRAADHVIDLGPAAGRLGGELVFEGPPGELERTDTATGRALAAERSDPWGLEARAAEAVLPFGKRSPRIRIVGARANNLKDVTVDVPLGKLVAVSGVSGSGKSSLVVDVLAAGAERALGRKVTAADEVGAHERIEGLAGVTDVVLVDQSPLGRSTRSNPATYTKAWEEVRALYARTPAARAAGLEKGAFSFNAPGGRCERCEGSGVVSIDMQFLADVTVRCDVCDGRRFKPEVLAVRVRGRNVAELLETTVDEAAHLLQDVPRLVAKLEPLRAAGLGYLRLGQSTDTLSGGEAQRLKIASFLGEKAPVGKGTLFVFDEPTTGLHSSDVSVLLRVFRRLLASGHAIVAVEHNLSFIAAADHVIELGPGGGANGGQKVFEGGVQELAARGRTATAKALRREG